MQLYKLQTSSDYIVKAAAVIFIASKSSDFLIVPRFWTIL